MDEPIQHRRIAIVGVGGVGTHAAITCGLVAKGNPDLIDALVLIDGDNLEEKNLARVPLQSNEIGYNKARRVKEFLRTRSSNVAVTSVESHLTPDTIHLYLDTITDVICCTDDITSQRMLHTYCRNLGIRYQRAGYDGDTINVCRQMGLTFDEAAEAADTGYHGVPEAYHAIVAGTLAVYSLLRTPITVMGDLASLGIKGDTGLPLKVRLAVAHDMWENDADFAKEAREEVREEVRDRFINDGWHHFDDCDHDNCHDDCYTRDSLLDVASDEGWHSSDDCDHDECITDVDEWIIEHPCTALDLLKALHDANKHPEGCPWCPAVTGTLTFDDTPTL